MSPKLSVGFAGREVHPEMRPTSASPRPDRARLAILLLAVCLGCGSGGGGSDDQSPAPIPGLCPIAFDDPVAEVQGVQATPTPVPLSQCTFDSNRNVTIGSGGCGPNVYVDKSFTGANGLGAITIAADGKLAFLNEQITELDTAGIVVDGSLAVGTSECPISDSDAVTINFTDARAVPTVTKGITVNSGGRLRLFGGSGVAPVSPPAGSNPQAPSWTYLAAPAGPPSQYGANLGVASPVGSNGATTLQVADTVDWRKGQWIVVAGTDFSPDTAEFVRIEGVDCSGAPAGACTITLDADTPLLNYHFGGPAPDKGAMAFGDGVTQNYGVDERAEVGLVSRNVKLTATITGTDSANGGEIMIMAGFNEVSIQGIELEKFGKDRLGSYPIHFHMAGTVTAGSVLIDSNSIHHSYNKCVTVHQTNGLTISNNVCARVVGHLYYLESGSEENVAFLHNLGIGAMSNAFSIPAANTAATEAFWSGDYLVNGVDGDGGNGYDGFNVAFSDDGSVTGTAQTASGFWITNLGSNKFVGNAVAGCQAFGRGFWILPGTSAAQYAVLPKGNFADNRAHGCYTGFDTAADDGVSGALLYTPQGACLAGSEKGTGTNCDVVTELDRLTATRNRNRGIWVRASWYAINGARLATNRDGVSLVSSGGTEGSPPGEWSLLSDSILVGMSANNPLRFGPCPYPGQNGFGGNAGCYEPVWGNGYPIPTPSWNLFGMMFYDGPARLQTVHFVNFKRDVTPYLTAADLAYLNYYSANNAMPCQSNAMIPFEYEGDAAMGWFQSNVNSYPPTQYVEGLTYFNVDLRHQIYTQSVENTCAPSGTGGNFRDGDKFTVILDHDQSLTGLQVVSSDGNPVPMPVPDAYPISLNNIPFLAGPGTADECLAMGNEDEVLEGRPTSLISPYSYATLELSALTAPCNGISPPSMNCQNNNVLIFTKDQEDYGGTIQFTDLAIQNDNTTLSVNCGGSAIAGDAGVPGHACVALTGRNGNGAYEPKVMHGLGYSVGASAGLPNFVSLMYSDASLPGGIAADNPFHARVGLCYINQLSASQNSTPPLPSAFTVYKGSKAFAGPNGNLSTLAPDFFNALACTGLDNILCPTGSPDCYTTLCPSPPYYGGQTSTDKVALPAVASIEDLDNATACPSGECYFYDETNGLLFLNVVQDLPNAGSSYSSPLGSCAGQAAGSCAEENFYSCPAAGCQLYTVLVDDTYSPNGPSACTPYGGSPDYTRPYPGNLNQLAYANGTVITTMRQGTDEFPHQALTNAPADFCPTNVPTTPDWSPAPSSAVAAAFTVAGPASVQIAIEGTSPLPGTTFSLLLPNQTYTLSATQSSGCSKDCSCTQTFTVNADGKGFTSSGNNCCQMGMSSTANTLPVAAPPYLCAGP